jgi:hypothetical protein
MNNSTVNGYNIKNNPVLKASDLKTNVSGTFVNINDTVSNALSKLDKLLDIEIIE